MDRRSWLKCLTFLGATGVAARDGAELGPYGRREVGGGQDHGERETAEQGNPPR